MGWLHDPDFFITELNPSSVPTLENYLDLRNSSMGGGLLGGFQYFRGEQHVLINREEFPCTDYTQLGSSFSQCVSQYLVNQVGCRLRWDYFRDKYTDIEECNDLEKIDQLLLYRTGILGASLEKVVRITNCQKPCTYMRYYKTKEMEYNADNTGALGFMCGFSSN